MNEQLWLPGLPFKLVNVFKVKAGQKVLNKATGKRGKVVSVKEGAPECIEAFIKFEGDSKEYKAYQFPELVVA